jgi:HK97 family phage portal protein
MRFIKKWFQKDPYSMDDLDQDLRRKIRGRKRAGIHVNEETALTYVTVFSCVRVLSEALAALPLFVYKEKQSGGKEKARGHPVYELLYHQPNDEMTSLTWRETQMGHLTLSGNCYSIITTNKRGQVTELYPVPWNQVNVRRNEETRKIEYAITDRGKVEVVPSEKVFHVPALGFGGIKGYSPIRMAQEAVGLGMAATEFISRFYSQGMNIGGVLEHPHALSNGAYSRLQDWVEDLGTGLANSWKPLILEEGMRYNRIPMPLSDAQFIETRKFTRDEICGLFRVPPHMIANLERATFNNVEYQGIEFVMYSLLPYVTRWEQAINWKLFTREERAQGYYAKFNVSSLLRGDYKSRQEGFAIMRQNGVINADEWRQLEEMNPQEGETGKVYMVNGNMIPIEGVRKKSADRTSETATDGT